MRKFVVLLLSFGLILAAGALGYRHLSQRVNPQVLLPASSGGKDSAKSPAPDFTCLDGEGNKVTLSEHLGAVPVVLNFWASWCPPCRSEMPDFDKVAAEYPSDTLRFFMVDMVGTSGSYIETREKAQEYLKGEGFAFTAWFDEDQQALTAYGITAFPTTVFIDADGNVEGAYRGAMTEEMLRGYLSQLYGL